MESAWYPEPMSEPPPHSEDLTADRWAQLKSREIEAQYREHFRDYKRLMLYLAVGAGGAWNKIAACFFNGPNSIAITMPIPISKPDHDGDRKNHLG